MRLLAAVALFPFLAACSVVSSLEMTALAAKEPLPYSIFVTGGAFVHSPSTNGGGPLTRTFGRLGADGDTGAETPIRSEAFDLDRVVRVLRQARVFVVTKADSSDTALRRRVADLPREIYSQDARGVRDRTLEHARAAGHDFVLVVDRIQDGEVQSRGVNDRWPFTIGAWLFALGALIPDRTYVSRARLWVSLRDARSGERVLGVILEPDDVDLNMVERCSLWGFVQSILVPPFWTSSDPQKVVASVRAVSTDQLMFAMADRLKSAEVDETLRRSGPAKIVLRREARGWVVEVESSEPLNAVSLRLDGAPLEPEFVSAFEVSLLTSRQGSRPYRYRADCAMPRPGKHLQVLVQSQTARQSSVTWAVAER